MYVSGSEPDAADPGVRLIGWCSRAGAIIIIHSETFAHHNPQAWVGDLLDLQTYKPPWERRGRLQVQ